MDAKIRDLLQKVKDSAVSVGRSAGKAAGELMTQAKLNLKIVELNSEIDAGYKSLGKMVYAVHGGVEIPTDAIDDTLFDIDDKKAEIDKIRAAIQKLKAEANCPACGKHIGKQAAFCSFCGAKIVRDCECGCDDCDCDCECDDEDCGCEDEAPVTEEESVSE
jgi:hypothetical protein